MAFTSDDLSALDSAIRAGVRTVSHNGRTITYHSLEEMLQLRAVMQAELATGDRTSFGTRRIYPEYAKGT
jgi:hypothetical protein